VFGEGRGGRITDLPITALILPIPSLAARCALADGHTPSSGSPTLGETTVDVIATPGHTPGTLSYIFPVKDGGRTLTVAYSGGTAFNFPRQAQAFAIYHDSQKKMADAARAAGATVLLSNHTEFDRAHDRVRLAQLPRARGEKHPYESDTQTVQRYFEMTGDCAEAQRLMVN
jgi:metallo-beta-lactamase class B